MKMMEKTHARCLLLNADYSPLHIICWQKALIWSMRYMCNDNYGIEIVDFYKDDFIQGTNDRKFPIPAVARTKKYFRPNNQRLTFSRKNIFLRDDYTCQYCGIKFTDNNLTYDHVVPKSTWVMANRSSATTWTNIVTACVDCNRKKGNRTPNQANMPLKNLPVAPTKTYKYLPITQYISTIKKEIPSEWTVYLPESYYL
jgi:5-methylcytosine-specific restriction endonuclease McrA